MLLHNLVKMMYVREGYLPNYPYHLISDKEMFDAFLNDTDECYFAVNYPCLYDSFSSEYQELKLALRYHIDKYLNSNPDNRSYELPPSWVYSYMLGSCITFNSDLKDRHDMLVLMNKDNIDDELTEEACKECLRISKAWVNKLPPDKGDHRPPTFFGELHVIKSLRLLNVTVLS